MSTPPQIAIIILAAGASTRLGAPKQLLNYNGMTLLRRTVETVLLSKAKSVRVVFGYEAEKMKSEIENVLVDVVINPNWQRGMSTSIRSGIQSLETNIDAVIIVLCDQPKLSTDILNTLIDTYTSTRTPIVTCKYAGTVGVPALFDRRIFPELLSLEGDYGAKKIIERHVIERIEIDFLGGEMDIDSMTDQEQIR
ncbi:MAG: nucleotidyltransferase family protein [Ignavibacteriales bacterium]|nr:nucleotidyltransferase family protein [Ignavibacteriales bacterium]